LARAPPYEPAAHSTHALAPPPLWKRPTLQPVHDATLPLL
jgi:hypothetical protein